ncbi:hypothetical protein POM88_008062 [Heracleum sosnowskyi]|uniref:Uncharacterized protein n=1 Tax=Heracleum sosnowskyi TaxID=360622 RepID=A0AAD8J5Y6_9APIA|nr:hypothetical protein POM88_008062 [Heracleum sosnowskyi]
MKEVTMELEGLRNFTKHPWANRHGHEEIESLISSTEAHRSDLYEIQLSSYNNIGHDSEQYSLGTANSELHIDNHMAARCCDRSGFISGVTNMYGQNILIANVITVVGCDDYGNIYQADNDYLPKGCSTTCHNAGEVPKDEISGTGCCQVNSNTIQISEQNFSKF